LKVAGRKKVAGVVWTTVDAEAFIALAAGRTGDGLEDEVEVVALARVAATARAAATAPRRTTGRALTDLTDMAAASQSSGKWRLRGPSGTARALARRPRSM
jgi:hypothetical protein